MLKRIFFTLYYTFFSYMVIRFIMGDEYAKMLESYVDYLVQILIVYQVCRDYMINSWQILSITQVIILIIIIIFLYFFVEWLLLSFILDRIYGYLISIILAYRDFKKNHPKIKWLIRIVFCIFFCIIFLLWFEYQYNLYVDYEFKGNPRYKIKIFKNFNFDFLFKKKK